MNYRDYTKDLSAPAPVPVKSRFAWVKRIVLAILVVAAAFFFLGCCAAPYGYYPSGGYYYPAQYGGDVGSYGYPTQYGGAVIVGQGGGAVFTGQGGRSHPSRGGHHHGRGGRR